MAGILPSRNSETRRSITGTGLWQMVISNGP